MAKGILQTALGGDYEVESAGVRPSGGVHPSAVEALSEINIDISNHQQKHVQEFLQRNVETVITVSDVADSLCPRFPTEKFRHHWRFDDSTGQSSEEELAVVRRVRDQMFLMFEAYAAGRLDERSSRKR
jgi:arsenate reductase (thioredoxin)